ncbi:hypothetical protein GCM10027515_25140 [Schumannella luteola]|uniref:DUF6194 domain-containing protein n=1 Tax=Schumannella luteola TaxID=472059 RepID=A0A852YKH3_9MICO|nr:DUF6194 family protein [Schumannella luteola]NYG99688.1 hypothetical protein [Schumannella luteola]TPX04871.1 erythromycin esterase [Schumannella luteola]
MTETEILDHLRDLDDVVVQTAGPGDGSPEAAWGDSFATVGAGRSLAERGQPFTTVVTKDYPGFDAVSALSAPGRFRVNVQLDRATFRSSFGFAPREAGSHLDGIDFAESDVLLPHPTYAGQSWACVVLPGERTSDLLRDLVDRAHAAALARLARRAE